MGIETMHIHYFHVRRVTLHVHIIHGWGGRLLQCSR